MKEPNGLPQTLTSIMPAQFPYLTATDYRAVKNMKTNKKTINSLIYIYIYVYIYIFLNILKRATPLFSMETTLIRKRIK